MRRTVRNLIAPGFRSLLRRQAREFLASARHCELTQRATLFRILSLNSGSEFQRDHRLDGLLKIRDFQQALPIAGYDRMLPYIERLKMGEHRALLGPRNRLLMFALTSGTTSSTKFIPITRQFFRDYRRGWQIWGIQAFDAHPALHHAEIFQLTSPWDQFYSPAGIPCGNISGLAQQMQSRILRCMYAVPMDAGRIADPFEKLYFGLKHGLCAPRLGMITTANPSTLCQMFRILSEHAGSLVRDLFQGGDASGHQQSLPPPMRRVRNRSRARHLDRLLAAKGTLRPLDVWPELQLVSVWTGGSAAAYLPLLRESLDDVPVRDHGLHASEGRMTIPCEDESASGLLDLGTHFFEFIPEAEIGRENPSVLLAHELVEDESYYVIMTTSSGLYRYDIQDVVQCTGFVGTTPLLRFLHKGSHISNLTGEKLTESQVVQAVTAVGEKWGIRLSHFTVAPQWGDPPRYLLLHDDSLLRILPDGLDLAQCIEEELIRSNLEYRDKRLSGRLAPLGLLVVPGPSWSQFIEHRLSQLGGSTEQYKHPYLIPKLDFLGNFLQQHVLSDSSPAARQSPTAH